jgi:hypothetical protein
LADIAFFCTAMQIPEICISNLTRAAIFVQRLPAIFEGVVRGAVWLVREEPAAAQRIVHGRGISYKVKRQPSKGHWPTDALER